MMKQQQRPQSSPSIVSNGDKKNQPVLDSYKFLGMESVHRGRTFCLTTRNKRVGRDRVERIYSNGLNVWKECFYSWRNRELPYCIGFDSLISGNTFLEVPGCLDKLRTLEKIVRSTGDRKTYLIQEQVKSRTVRLERQFLPVFMVRLVYRRKVCQLYHLHKEENRMLQK